MAGREELTPARLLVGTPRGGALPLDHCILREAASFVVEEVRHEQGHPADEDDAKVEEGGHGPVRERQEEKCSEKSEPEQLSAGESCDHGAGRAENPQEDVPDCCYLVCDEVDLEEGVQSVHGDERREHPSCDSVE